MKKVLILGVLLVVGAIAGGSAYYVTRATALPDWYRDPGTSVAPATPISPTDLFAAKLSSGDGVRYLDDDRVEITLNEAELNQVVMGAIATNPQASGWLQSAQGFNTTISGDRIESGMIVNLATVSTDTMPAAGQQVIDQLTQQFPGLANRDVYLGIAGSPSIVNGQLVLDDNLRIKVGHVSFSVDQIANGLGISPRQLEEQLNLTLAQGGITLDGIEFVDGEAVLSGLLTP